MDGPRRGDPGRRGRPRTTTSEVPHSPGGSPMPGTLGPGSLVPSLSPSRNFDLPQESNPRGNSEDPRILYGRGSRTGSGWFSLGTPTSPRRSWNRRVSHQGPTAVTVGDPRTILMSGNPRWSERSQTWTDIGVTKHTRRLVLFAFKSVSGTNGTSSWVGWTLSSFPWNPGPRSVYRSPRSRRGSLDKSPRR